MLVGEGCSLLLCLGTRCSTSIFLCALPSTQVLVVCDLLGSIKCCTAPFALGRKQALGFTPASLSVQHHALSWQKGSSFEHKASAICPCETSYLCYFLLPAICKLHYCAVERKIPFPSSPMHAMQLEKRKSKQFSLDHYSNVYFTCIVITRPFSGVLIDNLSRLVLADVRFACLIYIYACI